MVPGHAMTGMSTLCCHTGMTWGKRLPKPVHYSTPTAAQL